MNGQARESEQKIGRRIAGDIRAARSGKVAAVADNPAPILEGLGAYVHLIAAKVEAYVKVMLLQDDIERVSEGEDVRSALEGRVATIADRPKASEDDGRDQSAAVRAG